jgi:hypothetical protein
MQWYHVNKSVKVKGEYYYKLEEGEYFNTAYCDNDYQCIDCYNKDGIKGSNVINKGE